LRGHDADALQPRSILGYRATRCPLLYDQEKIKFYIWNYSNLEKGFLPNPGGSLDQPMKFWEVMGLIGRIFDLVRKDEQDAQQAESRG
jgi:hypothetical protein